MLQLNLLLPSCSVVDEVFCSWLSFSLGLLNEDEQGSAQAMKFT